VHIAIVHLCRKPLDPLPPGLSRKEFNTRIATGIEDATNRLVEAGRREQAQLFGRVKSSAPAKGWHFPVSTDADAFRNWLLT
jgi:hypothetical protein